MKQDPLEYLEDLAAAALQRPSIATAVPVPADELLEVLQRLRDAEDGPSVQKTWTDQFGHRAGTIVEDNNLSGTIERCPECDGTGSLYKVDGHYIARTHTSVESRET